MRCPLSVNTEDGESCIAPYCRKCCRCFEHCGCEIRLAGDKPSNDTEPITEARKSSSAMPTMSNSASTADTQFPAADRQR